MPRTENTAKFFVVSCSCNVRLIAVDMFRCFVIKSRVSPLCRATFVICVSRFVQLSYDNRVNEPDNDSMDSTIEVMICVEFPK
jgi:hypothetical protein